MLAMMKLQKDGIAVGWKGLFSAQRKRKEWKERDKETEGGSKIAGDEREKHERRWRRVTAAKLGQHAQGSDVIMPRV